METVLVAAVVAAALACPLTMLWRARCGQAASCHAPGLGESGTARIAERQEALREAVREVGRNRASDGRPSRSPQ